MNNTFTPFRLTGLLLTLAVYGVVAGSIFKILHLPLATLFHLMGFALIILIYPIRYAIKDNKILDDHVKLLFATAFGIRGVILNFGFHRIATIFTIIATIALVFLIFKGKEKLIDVPFKSNNLFFGSLLVLVLGVSFKILHLAYADYYLLCGMIFTTLTITNKMFLQKK